MSSKDLSMSCTSWKWPSVYLGAGFWEDQTKYYFFGPDFQNHSAPCHFCLEVEYPDPF